MPKSDRAEELHHAFLSDKLYEVKEHVEPIINAPMLLLGLGVLLTLIYWGVVIAFTIINYNGDPISIGFLSENRTVPEAVGYTCTRLGLETAKQTGSLTSTTWPWSAMIESVSYSGQVMVETPGISHLNTYFNEFEQCVDYYSKCENYKGRFVRGMDCSDQLYKMSPDTNGIKIESLKISVSPAPPSGIVCDTFETRMTAGWNDICLDFVQNIVPLICDPFKTADSKPPFWCSKEEKSLLESYNIATNTGSVVQNVLAIAIGVLLSVIVIFSSSQECFIAMSRFIIPDQLFALRLSGLRTKVSSVRE